MSPRKNYHVDFWLEIGCTCDVQARSPKAARAAIQRRIDGDWHKLLEQAECVHFESGVNDAEEVPL